MKSFNKTNSLVNPDDYDITYDRLKEKYAQKVIDAWDMQSDPGKVVNEGIVIASYLICTWELRYGKSAREIVRFVDIGCGNGLLVYLLNQENFCGIGIDSKARNIWSTAFASSEYKECDFDPKNCAELSHFTWSIGHSDKLTPWIPYVAMMISHGCEFFVLPMSCYSAWNFTEKYQRKNAKLSTYQCYLEHIESIIKEFGFHFEKDIMKIPANKQTCFLSKGRVYSEAEHKLRCKSALNVVNKNQSDSGLKDMNCVVLSKDVKVKSATELDKGLCKSIADCTAKILMKNIDRNSKIWCAGDSISFNDLVQAINKSGILCECAPKDQARSITSALEKMYRQVFIIRNGKVSLQDWSNDNRKPCSKQPGRKYDSAALIKSKLCWFYNNHPQGCNLTKELCKYGHGSDDLK